MGLGTVSSFLVLTGECNEWVWSLIPRQLEGTGTGGRLPQAFSTADMAGEENLTFCPNLCRNSEYVQHLLAFLSSLLSQNQFSKCTKQQHKWCTVHIISTISGNSVLCVFPMVIVFVEMEAGSPLGDGGAGNRRPWCCIYAEELLQEKERAVWCRRGPRSVASTRSLVSFMASWLTSIFMSTSCHRTSPLDLEYEEMYNLLIFLGRKTL